MIAKNQLPEWAICQTCGEPMKVVELSSAANKLGMHIPSSDPTVIRCCDSVLTMDDEEEFTHLRDLLVEYHGRVFSLQQ